MTSPQALRFSPSRPCHDPRETPELLAWRDLFAGAAQAAYGALAGVEAREHRVAAGRAWTVRVTRVPSDLRGRDMGPIFRIVAQGREAERDGAVGASDSLH